MTDKSIDLLYEYEEAVENFHNENYERAFEIFKSLESKGCFDASRELGTMYFLGLGVEKNIDAAYKYYLVAASNDDDEAIFSCAKITYIKGDVDSAINQFESSAERGFLPSYFWLGWLLLKKSESTEKNIKRGLAIISHAASDGHVKSLGFKFRLCLKGRYGIAGYLISPYIFIKALYYSVYLLARHPEDPRLLY